MAKILVVDDDPHSRELYHALLTPFGHQVIEAGDGREGLELAQKEKPDLIVSDILMPTMNGYDFVSAIRKTPPLQHVPVIFHSASFLDREARALGASCGVSLYVLKPCDPQEILDTVHAALGISFEIPQLPASPPQEQETIPLLLDAIFERGKQLDSLSARLGALLELALHLAGPGSVEEVLARAANDARKILGANYASVGLLEDDGPGLRSMAFSGVDAELAGRIDRSSFGGEIFKRIVCDRKVHRAFSPFGEPPGLALPPSHPPIKSFLGTRLAVEGRVYGWIYVAEKLACLEFDDQDARILRAVAALTALACENTERFRTIQDHAAKLEAEITERQRAEERFRVLVETAPTGIIITDAKGRIVAANARTLQIFGYERSEILGQPVEHLVPQALRSIHDEHREAYMANPHARPMGLGMNLFARRKNGTEFPVEIGLAPLVTRAETLISATIADITDRKRMEDQLRVSQRMEATGRLAGGVAHDFNNLVGVILGCCEALQMELPTDHPALRKVEMMRRAGTSAANLTRQLLAFGRKQILQPKVIEPKEVLHGLQHMLGRVVGENVTLSITVDPAVGCISADPGQLEQILINLAANARDAMPRGGQLTIEVANADLDEAYKQQHPSVNPGPYVMFAISDTGCGMDSKTQAQIFDPFFTTKEFGKGTGLGLASVYGIVQQSGGYIWFYSEVGKGTVFKVYLPRVEPASAPPVHLAPDGVAERGSETILLVEDSEPLRGIARESMEGLGYTIIEAGSGTEALQRASEFDGPIHLLMSDVVMPEMGGRELAEQMVHQRPGIKVLFTSGYADEAIVQHGVLEPGVAFIPKPYSPRDLARKIRQVLGEPNASGIIQEYQRKQRAASPRRPERR